jgi:hypothetical protein
LVNGAMSSEGSGEGSVARKVCSIHAFLGQMNQGFNRLVDQILESSSRDCVESIAFILSDGKFGGGSGLGSIDGLLDLPFFLKPRCGYEVATLLPKSSACEVVGSITRPDVVSRLSRNSQSIVALFSKGLNFLWRRNLSRLMSRSCRLARACGDWI